MTKLLSLLASTSLLLASLPVVAAPSVPSSQADLMPHTELKRGMTGSCRTVFQGQTVEPFNFEIIDVLHGSLGPKRDLILARLRGEKPEFTGVVAGMSGSPCYVNNRLIGALSYRFGIFTKEPIAGITPIRDMLSLFEIPERQPASDSSVYLPPSYKDAMNKLSQPSAPIQLAGLSGSLQPISTPLSFSGFDQRVLAAYQGQLTNMGFQPVMGSSGGYSGHPDAPAQLEMGGSIAGQLVRGDISISGTGTVSYIDGNRVLAFGHPFFGSGHVRIPMATSYVQHIMVSEMGSYKMAEDGREVGSITQDRLTAIYGTLGEHSRMIPVEVKLQDQTTIDPDHVNFEVFEDPGYTPVMMAMAIQNSLASRLQHNLGGNLSLSGSIKVDGKTIPIERFYSAPEQLETPGMASQDLAQTLFALWNNPFKQPKIEKVSLNFAFRPQTMIANIDEVWSDTPEIRPGDSVNVNVRLRSFRNETTVRQLKVQVPSDAPYGPLMLMVSNGPALDKLEDELKSGYSSYESLIDDLGSSRSSKRLYIKVITDEPGVMIYNQLYTKLPGSVLERLELPENISHSVPLMRSPGTEYSLPVDVDLQGSRFLQLQVSARGRVVN